MRFSIHMSSTISEPKYMRFVWRGILGEGRACRIIGQTKTSTWTNARTQLSVCHTTISYVYHTFCSYSNYINLVRRPPSSYNPKNPGSDADANSLNLKRVKGLEQRRSLALEEGVFTGEEDELVGALCLRCV